MVYTAVKTKLKKWGSSLGLVVPSAVVKEENLKEGEEVIVEIRKNNRLADSLGKWKMTDKEAKEIERELKRAWKGWGRGHKWNV